MGREDFWSMKKALGAALLLGLLFTGCQAAILGTARERSERAVARRWCEARGGVTEFRFPDGARADCLTAEYAVEFDWARKYAEAFGQAMHHHRQSCETPAVGCRRPAAVLILKAPEDARFAERLREDARRADVDLTVWTVEADR